MSSGSALFHIDAVDAFARNLYLRTGASPFDVLKTILKPLSNLHLALRHLRFEAADQDSLLNSSDEDAPLYKRQLESTVENCEFSLKQLEAFLDRFADDIPGENEQGDVDERELRVEAIRVAILADKTKIDMFLDTVQLQNNKLRDQCQLAIAQSRNLEAIKDTVDRVAKKVLGDRRTGECGENDEDGCWRDFKAELEKEGFSNQVLQKHKNVIRAYIREVEMMSVTEGADPPSVRNLLKYETQSAKTFSDQPAELSAEFNNQPSVPPKIPLSDESFSPKRAYEPQGFNSEPRTSSTRGGDWPQNLPEQQSDNNQVLTSRMPTHDDLVEYHPGAISQDDHDHNKEFLAIISTKDLLAMDALNANMAKMYIQSPQIPGYDMGQPPRKLQSYPPPTSAPQLLPAPPRDTLYSSSDDPERLGSQPRYVPPILGTSPTFQDLPQPRARLAPDSLGNEIPPDAQWTRVKRTLISPEVLNRAGVRYEARPDFVAILGRLSREQIIKFSKQSAEARASRQNYSQSHPPSQSQPYQRTATAGRARSNSDPHRLRNRDEERPGDLGRDRQYVPREERDSSSDASEPKSYQYIVDPPDKKTSPSTTVAPKSILKNKNQNHVRFAPHPHEVASERSPTRHSHEEKRRPRDRRDSNRDERDNRHGGTHSTGSSGSGSYGRDERDHMSDRRGRDRDRKKARRETLGAVGIGGAAVGLLGVLAQASLGIS